MDNVLIISSSDKGREFFTELLRLGEAPKITAVKNGGEARRMLISSDFDLIIINAPLADEFGCELAVQLTLSTMSGVMIVVKAEIADQIEQKVEDHGVFVIAKPVVRQVFYQAVKMAAASRRRMSCLKNENTKLQQKIEEIRLVDRAKCVLIQYLSMTEPQAHRYIEKQAMDLRCTRRQIAEEILKTYEN